MWCVPPEQDAAFVAAMEQVLAVYHRPYDPLYPVVNMDEQPIQLISHSRAPLPMRPGSHAKIDYEYVREGMYREKWARIWFASLARFHNIDDPGNWAFTDQDVIAFLRSCLAEGMPTRKRLNVVDGLILYRDQIRGSAQPLTSAD